MEPFIGQIMIWPANFAPKGWAFCYGQILKISEYSSLFAILGTTYGGDGTTNFALPDFRSRTSVGAGNGTGLFYYRIGERAGREASRLPLEEMPRHTHVLSGRVGARVGGTITGKLNGTLHPEFPMGSGQGTQSASANGYLADASTVAGATPVNMYTPAAGTDKKLTGNDMTLDQDVTVTQDLTVAMEPHMTMSEEGGGNLIPLVQPFTAMNYVIALEGLFPSRE